MHLQFAFLSIKHTVRMPFVEKTKKESSKLQEKITKTHDIDAYYSYSYDGREKKLQDQ